MLKKLIKILLILSLFPITLIASGIFIVFLYSSGNKQEIIYDYGVVFGAALRGKGKLSGTLENRMAAAVQLYHEGSVKKLILSGAKDPSEPLSMLAYAIRKNVNPKDVLLDENGDNTLKTIQNSYKYSTEAPNILYISSSFHLARIRITSRILGIKNADLYPSQGHHPQVISFVFRESAAIWYYIAKTIMIRFL